MAKTRRLVSAGWRLWAYQALLAGYSEEMLLLETAKKFCIQMTGLNEYGWLVHLLLLVIDTTMACEIQNVIRIVIHTVNTRMEK